MPHVSLIAKYVVTFFLLKLDGLQPLYILRKTHKIFLKLLPQHQDKISVKKPCNLSKFT